MKLLKPFFLSLLLNGFFIGLTAFVLVSKKQAQPTNTSFKKNSFKMKLHLKNISQVSKAEQASHKTVTLEKPKNIINRKKKVIENLDSKKLMDKRKRQREKKLDRKQEIKKEIDKGASFRPALISKINGLIKRKVPYPYLAIVKNMEGKVYYTLTLSPKGTTAHYKMTRSSGHNLLDQTVRKFFLKNPLEGKIALNNHQNKPLIVSDYIQFKIEGL